MERVKTQGVEALYPKQVNTEFDIQERGVKGYTSLSMLL